MKKMLFLIVGCFCAAAAYSDSNEPSEIVSADETACPGINFECGCKGKPGK